MFFWVVVFLRLLLNKGMLHIKAHHGLNPDPIQVCFAFWGLCDLEPCAASRISSRSPSLRHSVGRLDSGSYPTRLGKWERPSGIWPLNTAVSVCVYSFDIIIWFKQVHTRVFQAIAFRLTALSYTPSSCSRSLLSLHKSKPLHAIHGLECLAGSGLVLGLQSVQFHARVLLNWRQRLWAVNLVPVSIRARRLQNPSDRSVPK